MANAKPADASEKLYMQLNASELTAIIMKGSPHSNDRDAGFCSGSSEGGDDLSVDHSRLDPSSPTDASEDSVEVKVCPISLARNKRKSSEPSKVVCEREEAASKAPFKKRIRYTSAADSAVVLTPPAVPSTPTPPQLWDPSQVLPHERMPNPAHVYKRHPGVTTLHRPFADLLDEQKEPLALVVRKTPAAVKEENATPSNAVAAAADGSTKVFTHKKLQHASIERSVSVEAQQVAPALPLPPPPLPVSVARSTSISAASTNGEDDSSNADLNCSTASTSGGARPQQRNYKNMTRERRIEANARERTRVHTISAAYETLRQAVPSYSNAQKLSKLSVLRVACSYILTLSRMAGYDYSADQSEPDIDACFEAVTATIQTEGKIRKKKDE